LVALAIWLAAFLPAALIPNGIMISILVVGVALVFVRESRAPTLALVHRSVPVSLAIGCLAGLAMAFLVDPLTTAVAERLTGSRIDLSSLEGVHGNFANYLMLLALGLLFGGVVEEVVNRGFLVGWGSRAFGERWALWLMVVSAVGFGLAHAWQGPAGMITTGVSGLAYGAVYLASGRKLLPAMMTHATANFVGITQIYLYGTACPTTECTGRGRSAPLS